MGALVGDAGALQVEAGLLQLRAGLRVAHAQPLGFGAELFVESAAADFQQALVGVVFCHPRLNGLMLQAAGKQGALILLHLGFGNDSALVQRAGADQVVVGECQQAVHVLQALLVALAVGFHRAELDFNVLQIGFEIDGEGGELDLDVAEVGLLQLILQFAVFNVQVLVAEVEEDEAGAALDGVALADGGGKHLYFQRRGEHGVVAGFGFADEKDRG